MKKLFRCVFNILLFASFSVQAQEKASATLDLDAEWKQLLAERSYEEVIDIYAPVFEVEKSKVDAMDKEKCTQHYSALKSGVSKLPMSAALTYWTYRCAEVVGAGQEAEKYLQHFSQIAKHAFAQASEQSVARPIRIINQTDMFALVEASGLSIVEQYMDTTNVGRYLPWVMVLWDEKDQRERTYSFDFLEFVSTTSDKALGTTRAYRTGTARGLIRSYAKAEWGPAQDALATLEAASLENARAKIDRLKPQALQSARTSSTQMFVHCIEGKNQDCGQSLVDGMLDALEAKQSSAMVRMAALYSSGIGVKQDADASIGLLKAAEKRTGEKGLALYDFMYLQFDKDQIAAMPPKLMSFLERESFLPNKGKAAPGYIYMQMRKIGNETALQQYGAKLEPFALAGVEDSYELFASYHGIKKNDVQYQRWLEAAARAGHAFSQHNYASGLQQSKDKVKQSQAFDWMLESARNGNLEAVNWMADEYYDRQQWQEAAVWYEAAYDEGDIDAALELAGLYALAPKGTDYTEQDAENIYKSLSENYDSAAARRAWAELLILGKTLKHDLAKARQLIQKDADKSDAKSMSLLGGALLYGQFGAVDEKNGMAWLEKAESAGDLEALNTIATFVYFRKGDEASLKRAKMLWLKASLKKYMPAINNFAWSLCTSSYPGYIDAKSGLALFKMSNVDQLSIGYRDTYAACLAATGDYKAAVIQQQKVLDEMKARGFDDDGLSDMKGRLVLYLKNQSYLEPLKNKKP
ncbi:MAG: tetratricopeptide repeat protein [Arenimonas sp.]